MMSTANRETLSVGACPASDRLQGKLLQPSGSIYLLLFLFILALLSGCGGSGDSEPVVTLESGNLILTESHGGDGAAWGLPDCSACHALSSIHDEADLIRGIAKDKGYDSCAGCHGSNGTGTPRRCTICHNSTDLPTAPRQQGSFSHHFTSDVAGSLDDSNCISCHHASDMDGRFELNRDLTRYPGLGQVLSNYTSLSDFCLRCHNRDHQQPGYEISGVAFDNPLISIEDAFIFIDKHGVTDGTGLRTYAGLRENYLYATEVACTDCHAMHGTRNSGLIIDSSLKGISQLDSAHVYNVTITGGDYSQLCVMCHQMTTILDDGFIDTGNGLSGLHQVGGDCAECHSHGEAVQAGM